MALALLKLTLFFSLLISLAIFSCTAETFDAPSSYTYTALRAMFSADDPSKFTETDITLNQFAALRGRGVSSAILQFSAGVRNSPHKHPYANELLFVVDGSLEVGFFDDSNKHYAQMLQTGDMFVFPKGSMHYQSNPSDTYTATSLSSFSTDIAANRAGLDNGVIFKLIIWIMFLFCFNSNYLY